MSSCNVKFKQDQSRPSTHFAGLSFDVNGVEIGYGKRGPNRHPPIQPGYPKEVQESLHFEMPSPRQGELPDTGS